LRRVIPAKGKLKPKQIPDLIPGICFLRSSVMIRKLKSGEYRLYSRKKNPTTGRRRNLGTFKSRSAAEKHERAVQYFKHH
jgi:hypothetical protein